MDVGEFLCCDGREGRPFSRFFLQRGLFLQHVCVVVALCLCCSARVVGQQGLSLHDAIQRAEDGLASQVFQARVDEARGVIRQAGLRPNPRVYLSSEDIRPWADNFVFSNQTEDYGYLGQLVEIDGKRGKRVTLAQSRERIAEADRSVQQRQLAIRVTMAYWNAESMLRIAELLRVDMQVVEQMVQYNRERVDAGASRGVDLLRMQIERDRLAVAYATAQRDAVLARLQLFREIGQQPFESMLTDRLEDVPVLAPVPVNTVLEQRPDVQSAREAVRAAEADVKLQRAVGVPDPDVLLGYKRNGPDDSAFASVQVPLPFFNRNQGEVARARASVRGAQAAATLLENRVLIEVTQAESDYHAQQKIVRETLPEMRDHAKQNLQITSDAYRLGGIDLLRFIDAERTEFDVEVSAVRILAQLRTSATQLQLAYGVQP